jgi:hypothetical protein
MDIVKEIGSSKIQNLMNLYLYKENSKSKEDC